MQIRNASFDYARLLASLGIIVFHTGAPGAEIGYAGLSFFVILLAPFGLQQEALMTAGFGAYARSRANRLLLPWIGWGLLYTLAKGAKILLAHKLTGGEFELWMLATGPALHLWFLPFAFLAGLILRAQYPLYRRVAASSVAPAAGFALAALAFGMVLFLPYKTFAIPFAQYLFALPSFLLGLSFAYLKQAPARWAVMTLVTADLWLGGLPPGWLQLCLAGWVVLACFAIPLAETGLSRLCAALSLTIYLLHPLVLALIEQFAHLPARGLTICLWGMSVSVVIAILLHVTAQRFSRDSLWRRALGL